VAESSNAGVKRVPDALSPSTQQSVIDRNIETISRIEASAQSASKPSHRIADFIASFCGSVWFIWVHLVWFGLWFVVNAGSFMPRSFRFDPQPFPNLTLLVSLEAIFLSTFILISQNRQQANGDRRNHLDLQINLLAEQEASLMLGLLREIAERLDIKVNAADFDALGESTDPMMVIKELDRTDREPYEN
jgi:uncharacterized membrane protein